MKKTLVLFFLVTVLMASVCTVYAEDTTVDVTIIDSEVSVNFEPINVRESDYPVLLYKGVSYFPLTNDYLDAIGLSLAYSEELGLRVNKSGEVKPLEEAFLNSDNELGSTQEATIAKFKITVNGNEVDNENEEFPVLLFKNVTYFPMTWRFAVEEFGWEVNFDSQEGLSIVTMELLDVSAVVFPEIPTHVVNGQVQDKLPEFVLDEAVVGKWESVDFTVDIEKFTGFNLPDQGELFFKKIEFFEDGTTSYGDKWSKNLVDREDEVCNYIIGNVNGKEYLFYQWIKGKPAYYVLERVEEFDPTLDFKGDNKLKLNDENEVINAATQLTTIDGQTFDLKPVKAKLVDGNIVDNLNYDFVVDESVLNKSWVKLDCIDDVSTFDGSLQFQGDLDDDTLRFYADGSTNWAYTWTDGVVLHDNDHTAERYIVATINGKEYLFKEHKSGDYIFRYDLPGYMVYINRNDLDDK